MYPLGILFGLGFDTSSEIALLGISSIQGAAGTSIWLILILPLLFTAGMCLLDTVDGALMMALYTSTSLARDPIAVLYYNIVLTCITVMVAIVIGTLQALGLALAVSNRQGKFWNGVQNANNHYDIVGGAICGAFVVLGGLSVVLYKPWRRWVDKNKRFEGIPIQPDIIELGVVPWKINETGDASKSEVTKAEGRIFDVLETEQQHSTF